MAEISNCLSVEAFNRSDLVSSAKYSTDFQNRLV